jgi:hypothetical protein
MKWMIVVVLMQSNGQEIKRWDGPTLYDMQRECEAALKIRSVGMEDAMARMRTQSKIGGDQTFRMTCERVHDKVTEPL